MSKSSIHFRPVLASSTAHNERQTKLDYVYENLTRNNETWKVSEIETRTQEIQAHCKATSGRKLQKNAVPVREAVVNLNSYHSMEDLHKLADELRNEFKIDCFQIHIHRDEGKSQDELNHHAHMLFDWQNKSTGKMLRLNREDLSKIQDRVASTLEMERGELRVNSNRDRLEAVEYKKVQEQKQLERIQASLDDLRGRGATISQESDIISKNKLGLLDGRKTAENAKALILDRDHKISEAARQNKHLQKTIEIMEVKHEQVVKKNQRLTSYSDKLSSMLKNVVEKREISPVIRKWYELQNRKRNQSQEKGKNRGRGMGM